MAYGPKKIRFFPIPRQPEPEKLSTEVLTAFFNTIFDDEQKENSTVLMCDEKNLSDTTKTDILESNKITEKISDSSNILIPTESDTNKFEQNALKWFSETVQNFNFPTEPIFDEVLKSEVSKSKANKIEDKNAKTAELPNDNLNG